MKMYKRSFFRCNETNYILILEFMIQAVLILFYGSFFVCLSGILNIYEYGSHVIRKG